MLTPGKPQKGKALFVREMKLDFTRQDGSATILVNLQSTESLKTTAELRIYDADNRPVSKGEPVKISLRRDEPQERYWTFSLERLLGRRA
jgi:non-ribosomal peptide synthetase component E (peptide arylation enzyme)